MSIVLFIDNDQTVLRLLHKAVQDTGAELLTARSAKEGLEAIVRYSPDALLLELSLPDASGLELLCQVRDLDPKLPVTLITVPDNSHTAIEAMKLGAYDFLVKPLNAEQVRQVVERSLETRRLMGASAKISDLNEIGEETDVHPMLIGRSPAILEVYKEIGRIASQDIAILICGESGTGKELVAQAIYQHSLRCNQRFLAVNCAALSDTLLESELFGHEKGAFTGAEQRCIGKFEQCHNGTIFLDEVGDMSPATQSKVLRILQEQQFERVGGSETITTDVRIISATNRDLEKMIEDGKFRMDLYHRLHGYRIHLPPLRERGDDIPLLVGYLLAKFGKELGKEIQGVAPEAMDLLSSYYWPGNVRELQTVLRTAILKATGPVLIPEALPGIMINGKATEHINGNGFFTSNSLEGYIGERADAGSHELYAETLEMMEQYLLTRVLRETNGNQSRAANILGITRGSLRNKIHTLGISIEHVVQLET